MRCPVALERRVRFVDFGQGLPLHQQIAFELQVRRHRAQHGRARVQRVRVFAVEARRCVSLLLLASCQALTPLQEIEAIMSSIRRARRALGRFPPRFARASGKEAFHNHELCLRTLM